MFIVNATDVLVYAVLFHKVVQLVGKAYIFPILVELYAELESVVLIKMSGEKVHFLAELALYLCELVGLAGQFVNQLHTSLGGLYGLYGFRTEYILMRLVPVVCRNLTVGFQVLLQFPYIFFRFFQFFVQKVYFFLQNRCFHSQRFPFLLEQMFLFVVFPLPSGDTVYQVPFIFLIFDDQCRVFLNERKFFIQLSQLVGNILQTFGIRPLRVKLFLHICFIFSFDGGDSSLLFFFFLSDNFRLCLFFGGKRLLLLVPCLFQVIQFLCFLLVQVV